MSSDEQTLDTAFQDFLSAYRQADPGDRRRVADLLHGWAEQQGVVPGVPQNGSPLGTRSAVDFPPAPLPAQGDIPLRQIADNLEQVVWIRDLHSGEIMYISPAFETVWGRPSESFVAQPQNWIATIHPEDRVQVLAAAPVKGRYSNQEYRILRPDGSVRWIKTRTFPLTGDDQPPSRIVCVAQDITDQKKVEMALRKALDRTQELFALSRKMSLARKPGPVLKTLMAAQELRSAKRAALLFFDAPEEAPVRAIESTATWQSSQGLAPWEREISLYEDPALWELFQPKQAVQFPRVAQDNRMAPSVRELLLDGNITSLVIFPMLALGKWIGVLLVYYQEEHEFDSVELRHLKVLVDQATITLYNLQLLEAEEDLRREAERATEIKTQFLAMISHELRTPLTSIIGFTTTLLAEDVTWEPVDQADFIRTIRQEANRLQELIDHLLDLSRLEAGMLVITPQPQSFSHIVQEALPQLRAMVSKSGQELILQLPADLPPVLADPIRVTQVLNNLTQNAITYAPQGKEITLSASLRKDCLQVNVADQGPGFPSSERKTAFKAFRRGLHEDERPGKGAGLGLAICKRLIEAHGGRIWIKKQTSPGATISFTLLLAPHLSRPAPQQEEGETWEPS